ncbi:MAG: DNA translocase FtsK [Anaerolineales bacterium]|nr:DNA translocase FtsK [Anaerolineales bacterium]
MAKKSHSPKSARAAYGYDRDGQGQFAKVPEPDPGLFWLFRAAERLGRYWDDLLAVLLLVVSALSLLGLLGLTSGALTDWWVGLLRTWFGWGVWPVALSLGWVGALILLYNLGRLPPLRWGRLIAAEVALFALLGLFNLLAGGTLAPALEGQGGGLIGWGLGYAVARVLPPPADAFGFGAVFLLSLLFVFDVTADRLARLRAWFAAQGFGTQRTAEPQQLPLPLDKAKAGPKDRSPVEKQCSAIEITTTARAKPKLSTAERLHVPVETVADEIKPKKKRDRRLPPLDLLDNTDLRRPAQKEIDETASLIAKTLSEFGVPINVLGARVGPSVTQYQVEPGFVEKPGPDGASRQWKVRVAQIASLHRDIALALSASSIRIEAPVPGENYVGIEVPHRRTSIVGLRPILESEAFQRINKPLAIALGRDTSGAAVAADLGSMPHLLIAGTTGSGKSVCIISLVTCLIANNTPDDLRLVMIDPKMVELVRFNGLPHLYGKVETELTRILGVLRWTVREMDRRYKLFEEVSARNLDAYNARMSRRKDGERLPRIVVFVDELADLMMQAPDETERMVVRLAQMARATGIHLVVATQRPSTEVVTGLIKANFPARIAFAVASSIDSRVILDTVGAEMLLGKGDMLFQSADMPAPVRLQGSFVSEKEVDRIVSWWREQADEYADEPQADVEAEAEILKAGKGGAEKAAPAPAAPWDEMLARERAIEDKDRQIEQAIEIVKKYGTASASLLQRKMRIGYPRAARLMDELKQMGIVGREQAGGKTREVFIGKDDDPIGERAARILGGDEE